MEFILFFTHHFNSIAVFSFDCEGLWKLNCIYIAILYLNGLRTSSFLSHSPTHTHSHTDGGGVARHQGWQLMWA